MRTIEDVERARALLREVNQRSLDAATRGSCPSCESTFEPVTETEHGIVQTQAHAPDCRMAADVAELEALMDKIDLDLRADYVVIGAETPRPVAARVLRAVARE